MHKVTRSTFSSLPAPVRRALLHASGRYAPWEEGFDFSPPALRPGESPGSPDFVGIGAQRSGTTWWFGLIASHPEVAQRQDIHKERHFFDRFAARPFAPADTEQYHGWFPRPAGTKTGEWTPDYLHLAWVPPLLAEAAPETRLLVLLRDPVERFRSGLAHHRQHRGAITADAHTDALVRGYYHQTLRPWYRQFGRDQLLVLQYERCVLDPVEELHRTFRFLGLPPFTPERLEEPVSRSRTSTALAPDARRRLIDAYTDDVRALDAAFPEIDLRLWRNFSALVPA